MDVDWGVGAAEGCSSVKGGDWLVGVGVSCWIIMSALSGPFGDEFMSSLFVGILDRKT